MPRPQGPGAGKSVAEGGASRPKSKAAILAAGCPRSTRGGTVARDKHVAFEKVPRGVLHTFLSDLKSLAAAAGKALY